MYWIPTMEDYDGHIINQLKTITIDGQPIHVSYYMPESQGAKDLHIQRPAVIFFMYDQVHDTTRAQSITHQSISETSTDVTTRQIPTPMKFFYQFVVLTDFKTHENLILKQMLKLFPIRGYITLQSPYGENVSYDFYQKGFQSADAYLEVPNGGTTKERLFRKIYRYHLFAEVDESVELTYKKVTSVSPSVKEKEKE
jgi:hypothetical protein